MLPFIPSIVLTLTAAIILVVRFLKLKFTHFWLLSVTSAAFAWIILLISKLQVTSTAELLTWKPLELFPVSPLLVADNTAWVFAVAIVTIALSTLLIEVTPWVGEHSGGSNFYQRAALLLLSSISALAVMAGNLLTLLFFWVLLDMAETIIWLRISKNQIEFQKFLFNTFIRAISLVVLMFAVVISISYEMFPGFRSLSAPLFLFIAFAAGLRIAVLPLSLPFEADKQRSFEYASILRLIPLSTSLVILVRLSGAAALPDITTIILLSVGILSILSGLLWISRERMVDGLPFWIISASSLSLASSILGKQAASLTWSITTLMCVSLLILFHTRRKWAGYIMIFGLLNLSSIPLFAAWKGLLLYSPPVPSTVYIYLITQGLLVAGYYRYIRIQARGKLGAERWVLLVYPFGLALLPVTHFILANFGDQNYLTFSIKFPGIIYEFWPGVAAVLLALIFWLLYGRYQTFMIRPLSWLGSFFSLGWLYRITKTIYTAADRSLNFGNSIFEGRGGIFWSILLLILVIALIIQT